MSKMNPEVDTLRAEVKRLLADLSAARSDRDEALARLPAAQMEITALRKCFDRAIREEAAKQRHQGPPDESKSSPAQ
jgi:hypothetical protein